MKKIYKKAYLVLSASLLLSNLNTICMPSNLYNRLVKTLEQYKATKNDNILQDFMGEYFDLNEQDQELIIEEIKKLNIIVPGIVDKLVDTNKNFNFEEKKETTKTEDAIDKLSKAFKEEHKIQNDLELSKKNQEDATNKNKELLEKFKLVQNKNQELILNKQILLNSINESKSNLDKLNQNNINNVNTGQKTLSQNEIRANALLKNANNQTEFKIQELKRKKEELEKKLSDLKK